MSPMRNTLLLLAACALSSAGVAQDTPAPSPTSASSAPASCPPPASYKAPHLYGNWKIELSATGQTGRMTLRRHPEFTESLRGELRYGSTQSIASGDIEEGEFNLDESSDRIQLTATWTGKLVESSCGKEIRGEWHDLDKDVRSPFVLRREAGW